VLREDLFPVKLLKTLAKPLVDFDSGLWAASPAAGDIEDRVFDSGVDRGSVFPSKRQSARVSMFGNHNCTDTGRRGLEEGFEEDLLGALDDDSQNQKLG
jgi:hypothetical protein